jgi:hypothetical protein
LFMRVPFKTIFLLVPGWLRPWRPTPGLGPLSKRPLRPTPRELPRERREALKRRVEQLLRRRPGDGYVS